MLALGPWEPEIVAASWREDHFQPSPEAITAADEAIDALRERGSPSHDGLAARLAGFTQSDSGLTLELQPSRWALRMVPGSDHSPLSVLCVVRSEDGRWLAGRRAEWVASWPGRWALGAGGAVEIDEQPVTAMTRELEEEWSVVPQTLSIEALVRAPSGMALLVGLATVAEGADVVPDDEHDQFEWWPADAADWPQQADTPLRAMAALLTR
jgi:ADP-ribose pyrophosphatase YjhB (NUDIX family)